MPTGGVGKEELGWRSAIMVMAIIGLQDPTCVGPQGEGMRAHSSEFGGYHGFGLWTSYMTVRKLVVDREMDDAKLLCQIEPSVLLGPVPRSLRLVTTGGKLVLLIPAKQAHGRVLGGFAGS